MSEINDNRSRIDVKPFPFCYGKLIPHGMDADDLKEVALLRRQVNAYQNNIVEKPTGCISQDISENTSRRSVTSVNSQVSHSIHCSFPDLSQSLPSDCSIGK